MSTEAPIAAAERSESGQNETPFASQIRAYVAEKRAPFHMPGHKQGLGVDPELAATWGVSLFAYDLTEVDGSDYLNAPTGVLQRAQALAAQAFGAEATFFLVNGSTAGNQASLMSALREGDRVVLSRNAHQSTLAGLILSGAVPVYALPTRQRATGLYPVTSPTEIERILREYPSVKAVHLTSPTHIGMTSDVAGIAKLTEAQQVPLLVDEAHGAHFAFHSALPKPAVASGASVVVQSTHKTLGSLTQTSMLHLAHSRYISATALQRTLSLLQSSSPNTLFLMALDHARRQVALHGEVLLGNALTLARDARERINRLGPYRCYGRELVGLDDVSDIDETKLLIDVRETGYTGSELEVMLGRRYGIEVELSDESHILCFVTLGDSEQSIARLVDALRAVRRARRSALRPFIPGELPPTPELVLTPRQAHFAPSRSVPLESAVGEVVAEHVTPFPPDIPVIVPGERLDPEMLGYLRYLRSQQRTIVGPEDGTLQRIRVVCSKSYKRYAP